MDVTVTVTSKTYLSKWTLKSKEVDVTVTITSKTYLFYIILSVTVTFMGVTVTPISVTVTFKSEKNRGTPQSQEYPTDLWYMIVRQDWLTH